MPKLFRDNRVPRYIVRDKARHFARQAELAPAPVVREGDPIGRLRSALAKLSPEELIKLKSALQSERLPAPDRLPFTPMDRPPDPISRPIPPTVYSLPESARAYEEFPVAIPIPTPMECPDPIETFYASPIGPKPYPDPTMMWWKNGTQHDSHVKTFKKIS